MVKLYKKWGALRKYLGIVSILILIATYFILQSLVGKMVGNLWIWVIAIGYLSSVLASWFSTSGFWRKASGTVLIIIPLVYLVTIILFIFGLSNGSGF
jgi:hypothetical protein